MQTVENEYPATWEEPQFSDNSGEVVHPKTYTQQWKARELQPVHLGSHGNSGFFEFFFTQFKNT